MTDRKRLLVRCAAGDHALALDLDEDGYLIYFSLFLGEFYAGQRSFLSRWWERVKMPATILRGREYLFEDIVLEKDEVEKMREFIEDICPTGSPACPCRRLGK